MTKLKVKVNGQWKWMQMGLTPHPTLSGVYLQPADGGPSHYAHSKYPITAAALDNPNFFPIAVWFESVLSQSDIDADKDTGLNTYLELTSNSDVSLIRSNGMWAIPSAQLSGYGSETIGYLLTDEPDMNYPFTWDPGGGYTQVQTLADSFPDDGRIEYVNYGKGILLPTRGRPLGTQVYLNHGFQQTCSADFYWYTDTAINTPAGSAPWCEGSQFYDMYNADMTRGQAMRACRYGDVTRFLRDFVDPYRNQPIWGFVENGGPFTNNTQSDYIQPAQMQGAVWHHIIAGARGIIYFNHTFGGPFQGQHNFRDPNYAAIQAAAKTTNGQIQSLAAVLNDNFATGFASVDQPPTLFDGINHMVKYHAGKFYIFAGSRRDDTNTLTATFTIPNGVGTTATVLFESRTIPIVAGTFTDIFANGYTTHIYRID